MSKFIIAADQLNPEQQDAITNFLGDQRWEFWHWFDSIWLLAGVPEDWTAKKIHGELESQTSVELENLIVMRITDPITYWGRAPRESWPWMEEHWST